MKLRRKVVKMNSTPKTRIIILITLGILFVLLPMITINLSFIRGNNNKSSDYGDDSNLNDISLDNEYLKLSAVSEKIHIDNNWTAAKAAGICTGNGTYSEPYIIEDLVIDGGSSGSCILIEDSNVYFNIENCTVYNGGSGIKLTRTTNGYIFNNNVSDCTKGIFLMSSCNDNTIAGNVLNYHSQGIDIYFQCYNNIIMGNVVNNTHTGIVIQAGSDYNTVSGNIIIVYNECITSYDQGFRNNIIYNNSCVVIEDDGDEEPAILGYNLFFLLGILSVVVIILSKKIKKI